MQEISGGEEGGVQSWSGLERESDPDTFAVNVVGVLTAFLVGDPGCGSEVSRYLQRLRTLGDVSFSVAIKSKVRSCSDSEVFIDSATGVMCAGMVGNPDCGLEVSRCMRELALWDIPSLRLWLSDRIRPSFDVSCEEV